MAEMSDAVIATMSAAHEELARQRSFVNDTIAPEERRFDETLSRGLEMVDEVIARDMGARVVSGADAFQLHDTYGFPLDLTREIAAQHGLSVDEVGFQAEMEKQRE